MTSFDLAFWYSKDPVDASTSLDIYQSILDEAADVVVSNPAVGDFLADVVKVFPDLTEENMDNSPWMSPLYFSDAYVVASISWSRQQVTVRALTALARKRGLVGYDPQAETVIS